MKVLIGSHPKGYGEPFHPDTYSGRVLRKIIGDKIDSFIFFDLWLDEADQKSGNLSDGVILELNNFLENDCQLFALGSAVQKTLTKNNISHICVPHPASRRSGDRKKLANALHNTE